MGLFAADIGNQSVKAIDLQSRTVKTLVDGLGKARNHSCCVAVSGSSLLVGASDEVQIFALASEYCRHLVFTLEIIEVANDCSAVRFLTLAGEEKLSLEHDR